MLHPLEFEHVFTPGECLGIIQSVVSRPSAEAGLVGGLRSANTRRSEICWLDEDGESAWVFKRLLDTFAEANRRHFAFALEEFGERMQVALYRADTGGFFDWHVDFGDGPVAQRRKLTMVVQLSEADSYAGGELETNCDGVVRQASRIIGSALFIPSFVLHRVAPVREGERYSLTLWSHGPAFR
ncbi:MAG: 2OG-Fe(II) oxygenase [Alphaproteobacteria bacterium]|nr:2OG-Fe(II) oxygenase [Alphaproteobacteria bacterium]